jgi:hypothetical protein
MDSGEVAGETWINIFRGKLDKGEEYYKILIV